MTLYDDIIMMYPTIDQIVCPLGGDYNARGIDRDNNTAKPVVSTDQYARVQGTPRQFYKWSKSDWSSMRTDTKSWSNEWLKGSDLVIREQLKQVVH